MRTNPYLCVLRIHGGILVVAVNASSIRPIILLARIQLPTFLLAQIPDRCLPIMFNS